MERVTLGPSAWQKVAVCYDDVQVAVVLFSPTECCLLGMFRALTPEEQKEVSDWVHNKYGVKCFPSAP